MNIGNRYTDSKLYRGIRTSNGLPFLSEDFHEFSDTLIAKNNYLLENIVGSGMLNPIESIASISSAGLKLLDPLVLNIQGDVCLVKNSESVPFVPSADLSTSATGSIYLVGWYQHLTASSTIHEYGGVRNTTLTNDLVYEPLGMQVSTRYQFCWDIATQSAPIREGSTVIIRHRDSTGSLTGSSTEVTLQESIGSIYKVDAPAGMPQVIDSVYIIPVCTYEYDASTNSIKSLVGYPLRRTSSDMPMEISNTEPSGKFTNGTLWYNPTTREFKTYVEGEGFISSASKMGFIQYQYIDIATTDVLTPGNLVYQIDVPSLQENDIIHTTYEGLELVNGVDYEISVSAKTITLLDFTRSAGEKLAVTVTRLVEANDVTSLTRTITTHIGTLGNSTVEGHVKLSDSIDSAQDVTDGIAATPKAVSDSRLLVDDTTSTKYRFGVENGILYLEEV